MAPLGVMQMRASAELSAKQSDASVCGGIVLYTKQLNNHSPTTLTSHSRETP